MREARAMRNIVLLADGTGNSAASAQKTNVWRLYQALDLARPDAQIARYVDGVGTDGIKWLRLLGLALGIGVKRNVLSLYRFACRNHRDGDRVAAFGFSRGAFTIRVLADMIASEGLVEFVTEPQLARDAARIYRRYRATFYRDGEGRPNPRYWWLATPLRRIRDQALKARDWMMGWSEPPCRKVPVHFLGVWDTVAAYGLPIDELTDFASDWIWPMKFDESRLPDNVLCGRQAFSLDDCRQTFRPIPWEPPADPQGTSPLPERLRQVWFAGVHSNVGGGYSDDRLAHISLAWMLGEGKAAGLLFDPEAEEAIVDLADPDGKLYDSRAGGGLFYRYRPRCLSRLMKGVPGRPLLHYRVLERIAHGSETYAPIAVDCDYDILDAEGCVAPGPTVAATKPFARALALAWWRRVLYFGLLLVVALIAFPAAWPYLAPPTLFAVPDAIIAGLMRELGAILPVASALPEGLAGVGSWWFAAAEQRPTIGVLLLVLLRLILAGDAGLASAITEAAALAWRPAVGAAARMTAPRLRAAPSRRLAIGAIAVAALAGLGAALLPLPELRAAAGNLALVMLVIIGGATAIGRSGGAASGVFIRFAEFCRSSGPIVCAYRIAAGRVLPGAIAVAALLAAVLVILLPLGAQAVFQVRALTGNICVASGQAGAANLGRTLTFDISARCWASGVVLEKGHRYRITMDIPPGGAWFDNTIATDLGGYEGSDIVHLAGALYKRWWGRPWFQPIARFGAAGASERALTPLDAFGPRKPLRHDAAATSAALVREARAKGLRWWDPLDDETAQGLERIAMGSSRRRARMVAEVVAPKSGELFLYVNDAVPVWPLDFYRNNRGLAKIRVVEVPNDSD
jgi:uncharacterized protein (DUF2235 family)